MNSQFSSVSIFCLVLFANNALSQTGSQPPFESMSLYRIQVEITTGKREQDGTDDRVYVKMNGSDQRFFLNRHINDFKPGTTVKYDVISAAVDQVKDIQFLEVGLLGDDQVCISTVELILNNRTVFAAPGRCLDNNARFTIDQKRLRADTNWRYNDQNKNMWKSPNRISKSMILSLVEGSIGNQLSQEQRFKWEGRVNVSTVDDRTLKFHFPLERDVVGPNPKVDISFDLKFSCNADGKVRTSISNVKVTSKDPFGDIQNWVRENSGKIIGATAGALSENPEVGAQVAATIEASGVPEQLKISTKMNVRNPNLLANCKVIRVTPNSDIELR